MFLVKTIETSFEFLDKVELLVHGESFVDRALPEGMLSSTGFTGLGTGLCSQGFHRGLFLFVDSLFIHLRVANMQL